MDQSDLILQAIEALSKKIDTTNHMLEKLLSEKQGSTQQLSLDSIPSEDKLLYSDNTSVFTKSLETNDLNHMTFDYPAFVSCLLEALENSSEIKVLPPYGILQISDLLDAVFHPSDRTIELVLGNLQRVIFELDPSVIENIKKNEFKVTKDGLFIVFPDSFTNY